MLLSLSYISIEFLQGTKLFFLIQERYTVSIKHSHKKRKDSLEGSLDRVLFVAELGFPNM